MLFLFGLVSILFSVLMLVIASVSDLKFREVTDKLWVIAVVIGFVLAVISFEINVVLVFLLSVGIVFGFIVFLYKVGEIAPILYIGGGDLKALVAIVALNQFTSLVQTVYFSLSVFLNALILSAVVVPVSLLVWNLVHGNKSKNFLFYFIGYPVKISLVKHNSFVSPLETVFFDEIEKRQVELAPNVDSDEEFERLKKLVFEKKIEDIIWVTPLPPFMFALLVGYLILALVSTNLLFVMVFSVMKFFGF